jgi:hypothetical protein
MFFDRGWRGWARIEGQWPNNLAQEFCTVSPTFLSALEDLTIAGWKTGVRAPGRAPN